MGVLWEPDKSLGWAHSHATCPTPIKISDNTVRIFIQSRDRSNIGRVGYIDVLNSSPSTIVSEAKEPVLDIGSPGSFDDSGVFQCSVINPEPNIFFMYYAGFELLQKVRYRILTGLAISNDGGSTFIKYKATPILERSDSESVVRGGPSVIFHNDLFKMWYVAGSNWELIDNKYVPLYSLKYLESKNGINWKEEGEIVFDPSDDEHGFGRPLVYPNSDGTFEMLYSVRKREIGYRMGFAKSKDGVTWIRKDSGMDIGTSEEGPDSKTIEFGAYISETQKNVLLYNGNDFGKSGLLWATKE